MLPIRDINPTRIFPLVTLALIAASVVAYVAWQPDPNSDEGAAFLYERAAIACELTTGEPLSLGEIANRECVDNDTMQQPYADKNVWLAAVVSIFLHGSILHIAGNMWFLWIFGNNVEEAYGTLGYLVLYLFSGLAATAGFVALNAGTTDPLVGASGAIAGILGAYIVLFPGHRVMTYIFPFFFVPVPALLFLGIWFVSQFGIAEVGIAWEAHVAGFLVGAIVTLLFREPLLRRVRNLHAPRFTARNVPF